jgi:hypothetical protein
MTPEGTTAKKGAKPCDIEREAEKWDAAAETLGLSGAFARGYAQYALGRAAGLRQALEIIGREK